MMRNAILICLTLVLFSVFGIAAASVGGAEEQGADPLVLGPAAAPALIFDEHCCSCDVCGEGAPFIGHADRAEYEISEEQMVEEVVMLWQMWFDDEGAKKYDRRRDRFTEFAEYVVDAVVLYQDTPTEIGGQLPGSRNDHLMVAVMIAKESSVTYDVEGRSHQERGLMQVHGKALAGYSPEVVQKNPKLGILLGVRWIAAQIPKCRTDEELGWEDADWAGPLSRYAGGQRGMRADGTCARFTTIRERVRMMQFYRARIDREMEHWRD